MMMDHNNQQKSYSKMGRASQFFEPLSDLTELPLSDLPGSNNGDKLGGSMPYSIENSQTRKLESTVSSMNPNPRPWEKPMSSVEAMREMIFRIAVMQPIEIDPEAVKPPKRRNVKISKDPQSVAARHRREKISERIRILQRLVPGGTKMDTASMLDEAIHYVKFLKTQVQSLEGGVGSQTSYGFYHFSQNGHPFHNSS